MIKMSEYAKRRKQIMQKIGPTGVVIVPSSPEIERNGDANYPFRQNSDFYYLTGFDEPDAILVLVPHRTGGEFILFNRVHDKEREIWDGPRAGQEGACKDFLADEAFPITEIENHLPRLLAEKEAIYYPVGLKASFDALIFRTISELKAGVRSGVKAPIAFIDVGNLLHEMRLFKSKAEIALIQEAIDITDLGHRRAMATCKAGLKEYELEAELLYEFYRHGSRFPAYSSIVGSGENTCVLHYSKNNRVILENDLVLIDAGAEYQNYAADITRTFPANGHFSAEQRAIYELVFESQRAAMKAIRPGVTFNVMQEIIVKVLTEGLIEVGILKGKLNDLLEKGAYRSFYMHRSGHWLGLDVHDAGAYKVDGKWRKLAPGMVFTVEPGLYISAHIPGVHRRWHNIGIRIEDNVLVTDKGYEVLSHKIPKRIDEIEMIMAK